MENNEEDLKGRAALLDAADPLKHFRDHFVLPTRDSLNSPDQINGNSNVHGNSELIYLCTNSLGLPPKAARTHLNRIFNLWGGLGVLSHTHGPFPTETSDVRPKELLAEFVVGAKLSEVAVMESLTSNIHTLLSAFYQPSDEKNCILVEKNAFPSDYYAVESQIILKNVPPCSLLEIDLRPSGRCISTEEIIQFLKAHSSRIALVWFPGGQYLTGQVLDIAAITEAVHEFCACPIGWDLAHAAGNIPLHLHDWQVDCAAWCGYKYLCGSPGGCAGIFVHEKHHLPPGSRAPSEDKEGKYRFGPVLTGWWGHLQSTRFQMTNRMEVEVGANAYRRSCPSSLLNAALTSSLEVIGSAGGVEAIREKSIKLTGFLEDLLTSGSYALPPGVLEIITPREARYRGAQLSLRISVDVDELYRRLLERGVICDTRKPCYVRVAPYALYNTFTEILQAAKIIHEEVCALLKQL